MDVWITNTQKRRINTLAFGESFNVCFLIEAHQELKKVALACHIANNTGLRITGQTYPAAIGSEKGQCIDQIPAGTEWTIEYSFHGGLWPGVYFLGGGLMSFVSGTNEFIHRVVDYRAMRILEDGRVSIIGASSLQSRPPQIIGLPTAEPEISPA